MSIVLVLLSLCAATEASEIPKRTRADFTRYLKQVLPRDSPLRQKNNLARAQFERDDYLEYARPLKYFAPYRLVPVLYWAPGAGAPGQVLEDVRVLWNPGAKKPFALSSLAWIAKERARKPLDVGALSDAELAAYITEIVSLIPRADRWGFRIDTLERRDPRTAVITYSQPNEMSGLPEFGDPREMVRFDDRGAVKQFKMIQRTIPEDR